MAKVRGQLINDEYRKIVKANPELKNNPDLVWKRARATIRGQEAKNKTAAAAQKNKIDTQQRKEFSSRYNEVKKELFAQAEKKFGKSFNSVNLRNTNEYFKVAKITNQLMTQAKEIASNKNKFTAWQEKQNPSFWGNIPGAGGQGVPGSLQTQALAQGGADAGAGGGVPGGYGSFAASGKFGGGPAYGAPGIKELPETEVYAKAAIEQDRLAGKQEQDLTGSTQQYQELAGQYKGREKELTSYLEGLGGTERRDINERYDQARSSAKQDLINRGMTSTSALDSIMRGVGRDRTRELGAFEERLRGQKLDYRTLLSGQTLGAQQQAIGFGAGAAQANFAAGQVPTQTMGSLANMMAQQRAARFSGRVQYGLAGLDVGARNYAAALGYKADIAGQGQEERITGAQRGLDRYQIQRQTSLGYSGLANQLKQAQIQAASVPVSMGDVAMVDRRSAGNYGLARNS